jgi:hypothetical protein
MNTIRIPDLLDRPAGCLALKSGETMAYYLRQKGGGKKVSVVFHHGGRWLAERTLEALDKPTAEGLVAAALNKLLKQPKIHRRAQAAMDQADPGHAACGPAGSLSIDLSRVMGQLGRGWKKSTLTQFIQAEKFINEALAATRLDPTPSFNIDKYYPIRTALDEHPTIKGSKRHFAGLLRRLTEELVLRGLPAECLGIFRGLKGKSQLDPAGLPFDGADVQAMHAIVPAQPWVVRMLYWTGLSGGAHIGDASGLLLSEVNLATGKVYSERNKQDGILEFVFLEGGLECLKERQYPEGSIFLIPELVYTEQELQAPGFRENAKDLEDEDRRKTISARAQKLFNPFLVAAGVKAKGKTYKSFRQELTSHLFSLGLREIVIGRLQGNKPGSVTRYAFPAEWEFFRVRDLREQRLQAVLEGREPVYHLSLTEAADAVIVEIKKDAALREAAADRRQAEVVLLFQITFRFLHGIRSDMNTMAGFMGCQHALGALPDGDHVDGVVAGYLAEVPHTQPPLALIPEKTPAIEPQGRTGEVVP